MLLLKSAVCCYAMILLKSAVCCFASAVSSSYKIFKVFERIFTCSNPTKDVIEVFTVVYLSTSNCCEFDDPSHEQRPVMSPSHSKIFYCSACYIPFFDSTYVLMRSGQTSVILVLNIASFTLDCLKGPVSSKSFEYLPDGQMANSVSTEFS